jgi:hypothetical protein
MRYFQDYATTPEACAAKNDLIQVVLPKVASGYGLPSDTFRLNLAYAERCEGSGEDYSCYEVCEGKFITKNKGYRMYRVRGEKRSGDNRQQLCEQDAAQWASQPGSVTTLVRVVGGGLFSLRCAGYAYQILPRIEP